MSAFTALFGTLASTLGTAATGAAATGAAASLPAALGSTAAVTAAETAAGVASVSGATGGAVGAMGTGGFLEAGTVAAPSATEAAGSSIFTTKNVLGAATSLGSKAMQYSAQKRAEAAQERAADAQGKMASMKARNARLDALAQWRRSEGERISMAGNMGVGAKTSGLAQGGAQTALAKEWGDSRSLEGLAATAGNALQSASNYSNQAAGWQALGGMIDSKISPSIFQRTQNPNANLSTNTVDWIG